MSGCDCARRPLLALGFRFAPARETASSIGPDRTTPAGRRRPPFCQGKDNQFEYRQTQVREAWSPSRSPPAFGGSNSAQNGACTDRTTPAGWRRPPFCQGKDTMPERRGEKPDMFVHPHGSRVSGSGSVTSPEGRPPWSKHAPQRKKTDSFGCTPYVRFRRAKPASTRHFTEPVSGGLDSDSDSGSAADQAQSSSPTRNTSMITMAQMVSPFSAWAPQIMV